MYRMAFALLYTLAHVIQWRPVTQRLLLAPLYRQGNKSKNCKTHSPNGCPASLIPILLKTLCCGLYFTLKELLLLFICFWCVCVYVLHHVIRWVSFKLSIEPRLTLNSWLPGLCFPNARIPKGGIMNMDYHAQLLLWAVFLLLESFVFICIFICLFDWELNPDLASQESALLPSYILST